MGHFLLHVPGVNFCRANGLRKIHLRAFLGSNAREEEEVTTPLHTNLPMVPLPYESSNQLLLRLGEM